MAFLSDSSSDARYLRLDTLVRLRWLAIIGQSAAVTITHFGLGFRLPFALCFLVISFSAWLNILLRIRYPVSTRLSDNRAAGLLAYDIIQLAALLFLTGGLKNPFSILFLAPVLISATALKPSRTFILGLLAILAAGLLAFVHEPLPWRSDDALQIPPVYVFGIWLAIANGIAFTGIYAWRVAEEARSLGRALTATELVLAREQHLSQLDGLAAAAAHELGTPLATIALVAKELDGMVPKEGPLREDIDLLREQVERCRLILGKLTSLGDEEATPLDTMSLAHLIEEIAEPQRPFGVPIRIFCEGEGPEPVCRRSPAVIYGLANLVDNALDFAKQAVFIDARWTLNEVRLDVRDDGPGFPPDILMRIGEPYVTSRGARQKGGGEPGDGLGLGLFIAKTLLERSGASLTLVNAMPPATGAVIQIRWPRSVFEQNVAQKQHIQSNA